MSLMTLNLKETGRALAILANMSNMAVSKLSFVVNDAMFEKMLSRYDELGLAFYNADHRSHTDLFYSIQTAEMLDHMEEWELMEWERQQEANLNEWER